MFCLDFAHLKPWDLFFVMNVQLTLLVIFLLSIPYVGIPLMFWRTKVFNTKPRLRRVLSDFLPKSVNGYFESGHSHLIGAGFEPCFDAVLHDQADQIRVFFRMYVKPKNNVMAIATSFLANDNEEKPLKSFLEFVSRFSDDTELITTNSDLGGAPIESSSRSSRTFLNIRSPLRLLKIHEHFLSRSKKLETTTAPFLDKALPEFEIHLQKELEYQEKIGGLRFDAQIDGYRPTIAGAFLMTWSSMWPVSAVRRFYQKQKAKIWLRQLKIEPT